MRPILFILAFISLGSLETFAQKPFYNTEDGLIAQGYDVVEYFKGKAVEGSNKFSVKYDGVTFQFSSDENKKKFVSSPEKYIPQYGGWCAYAMGAKGEKVTINPKTFEIRDGKLYLFYNAFFNNTFESWKKEGPEKLRKQADENWKATKHK